ncbi:hypothetical protein ACJMK2_006795 [Sinanodonta woodiana]|uniref:Nuclear pore complex protein n=1 Tax=Sinanodonta woodiana TaxID=1069815 RepID=A0ABD3VXH1_SINWO
MAESSFDESFNFKRQVRRSLQPLATMLEGKSPALREQEVSKTFRKRSTNLNVQRSLQILDESIYTPSQNARTARNLQHTTYTPKQVLSGSKFDVSSTFRPTPKKTPQSSFFKGRDSFHTSFTSTSALLPEEDMAEEITTTNIGLLLEEDPGNSASKGLYQDFKDCLQNKMSQDEMFSLIQDYETICEDQVTLLKKLVTRASKQEEKCQKTSDVLYLLKEELASWKLLHALYRDKMEMGVEQNTADIEELMVVDERRKYYSDKIIVDELFKRDYIIRQGQIVVDWLEHCSREDFENIAENIKFFSDRAVGWENTLHRLQNKQPGVSMGSERPLVDEIDPDAPIRQNKLLDDLDKEDEDRLMHYIFICIRAGKVKTAQEVCRKSGQSWRAATLEGYRLYHDDNFESPDGQPVQGNAYRDVWKSVCWTMVQDPRIGQYEKAIYGILSGNLRATLPVCKSWLDYVWAYFRTMVDMRVEEEIRAKTKCSRPLEPLPDEYFQKVLTPSKVFQEIEACENVRDEAHAWYHVIQKYLILGDTHRLVELMYEWVRQGKHDKTRVPMHLLRFMVHLVLFFRSTHQAMKEELTHAIIEAYVENIIAEKHHQLVAHYVSHLPPDAQVYWYARFLEGITDREEQQQCLMLAEKAGLDIPLITKTVVENIRSHSDINFRSLSYQQQEVTTVTEEDRKKIEAINWLVFDESQRAEAMRQTNAVMRSFIAVKKLEAAREIFEKLPPDSVDVIHRMWHLQTGCADLPFEERNTIREYLCIKAYLDAIDSFNDWFKLNNHGKPTQPSLGSGSTFTEKVAHEHRMKQYEQELERWRHSLNLQTQTTKEHIYNVLLFADGGWMVDQNQNNEMEEDMRDIKRQEQMEGLRGLVLPGLCFLLHNVLHTCQQYIECLRLADVVASEQHKLYQVFRKDELQHLLHLLRESSLAVLDLNCDPLGYDLQ